MKLSTWILMLALVLVGISAAQNEKETTGQELNGTIKEVSINIRRVTIETTQHQEKMVSVEPGTRIFVNRREGKIEQLKPGQPIRVVLQENSSKALLIEVS